MGGCYGRGFFDRAMEAQLFRYLDNEYGDDDDCSLCKHYKLKPKTKDYKKICQPCIDTGTNKGFTPKKAGDK